jgi:glycosyltransferase involved in cell wall biosynthesis
MGVVRAPAIVPFRPYVIVAADFIRTGGMDRANYALARHLARRGHETHLVSYRVAHDLAGEPNVRVHLAPRPGGSNFLGGPLLGSLAMGEVARRRLRRGEAVVNGGNCPLPGTVNWVHYVHAADAFVRGSELGVKNKIARATEKVALHGARLVLANSERTRRDLVEHIGVDGAKIRVVYLGVDAEDFRPRSSEERRQARESLGWPESQIKVAFVGALGDDRKGFGVLYEAWRTLCRSTDWDADLVAVGIGRQLAHWRERANADGLGRRIEFLGFRPDVPRLVGACDLLVAPSLYEPYGLASHEALSSGIPAITSAVSGVAEVYPDELRGWLLPDPRDSADLVARIRAWRETARAPLPALQALSDRLRARTWDVVARDIVQACEEG